MATKAGRDFYGFLKLGGAESTFWFHRRTAAEPLPNGVGYLVIDIAIELLRGILAQRLS